MPEGDAIHRAARRLQPLVGEHVEVETPHARARAAINAAQYDGRRLESVTAHGKNLVFRFEGGLVIRSHLRMSGRLSVRARSEGRTGTPWLVMRGGELEAALWNGPVLEPHLRALAKLGPDILANPPGLDAMLTRMRAADPTRTVGETLLDQSVVSGIGNMWLAETLWRIGLSPWRLLRDVSEPTRRSALETAAATMSEAVENGRTPGRNVYRQAGRPCPRCGTRIESRGQGDANRIAYWCPGCQS
ncbi:MAG TPA: DNA-formamidopyrimidine glycosylase family protein [Gaiellaceae bacterium]